MVILGPLDTGILITRWYKPSSHFPKIWFLSIYMSNLWFRSGRRFYLKYQV